MASQQGVSPPLNLVMLGPPGAGKGTQAERISRTRKLPKISTGDILREAVHNRTELGCAAKEEMEAGHLVSDDVMIGIVRERLNQADARKGFVLDGFPRTIVQANALDRLVHDSGEEPRRSDAVRVRLGGGQQHGRSGVLRGELMIADRRSRIADRRTSSIMIPANCDLPSAI